MCGIVAIFGSTEKPSVTRKLIVEMAKKLRHRGPDWSGVKLIENGAIAHERLAIVDPESGEQPLVAKVGDSELTLAVNGEIYNHLEIREALQVDYAFRTKSDCECILPLYLQHGPAGIVSTLNELKGMFGFVLHDSRDNSFVAARDYMGIIPLYIGWGADGSVVVASELKAIANQCVRFQCFPPGHLYSSKTNTFVQWYQPKWFDENIIPTHNLSLENLRSAFTDSVRRRMMSDVPWGVLLSGGLDSSLVASVACRLLKENVVSNPSSGTIGNFGTNLHSFCIGLKGSPDLAAAQKVADFLGTIHHTYTFTVQEGLDAVSDVIYSLETFDTTTIRAATPMYLMSRKIKAMGVKMVLSGEGADEIFGGYLYFHKAPSSKDLHQETVRKLQDLHLFDCLRANKSTSAWGVEARVPFLDRDFLDVAMGMNPTQKMCIDPDTKKARMEKWFVSCLESIFLYSYIL
jgi:asparagine synthase (glutamine-hydrolysing)